MFTAFTGCLRRGVIAGPEVKRTFPPPCFPCKDGSVSVIVEWSRMGAVSSRDRKPAWAQEPRYHDFYAMGERISGLRFDALNQPMDVSLTPSWSLAALRSNTDSHGPVRSRRRGTSMIYSLNDRDFLPDLIFDGSAPPGARHSTLWRRGLFSAR